MKQILSEGAQIPPEKNLWAPSLFICPPFGLWVPFLCEGNDMAVVISQVNSSATCKCFGNEVVSEVGA